MINYASIPLSFWDDVFATSVYLINKLPSSSHQPSPYTQLLNKPPTYNSFRILGCACYPHLRPYTDHKLQPRALPCVFIGYALSQKATSVWT
jgi:hypothetical protein